jgi:hypothetical protein
LPIAIIYLFITGFTSFPTRTLQVTLIGLGSVLLIFSIYLFYLQQISAREPPKSATEYAERMQNSNMGFYIGEGRETSNSRLGSVVFWWVEQTRKEKYLELLVGHGLGASKSGGVFHGSLSDVGSPYYGLMLDRTGLSGLLWDIGIVGTFLFSLVFISGWSLAKNIRKYSASSKLEKSILWGIECGIILLALSNIYDKYLFTNPGLNAFTMLVFAFVVGMKKSSQTSIIQNQAAQSKD